MSEFSDDDALAAEYVIGTLDPTERKSVDARRRNDAAFDQVIEEWSSRLAPLLDAIPSVEPSARLHEAVTARIDRLAASPANDNVVQLRRQLRLWRSATALSVAAALVLALWGGSLRWSSPAPSTYVAVLQQGGSAPAFLVTLDLVNRRMTVTPSAATTEPDKSLQLWMIAGNDAPQSLGLVDAAKLRSVLFCRRSRRTSFRKRRTR